MCKPITQPVIRGYQPGATQLLSSASSFSNGFPYEVQQPGKALVQPVPKLENDGLSNLVEGLPFDFLDLLSLPVKATNDTKVIGGSVTESAFIDSLAEGIFGAAACSQPVAGSPYQKADPLPVTPDLSGFTSNEESFDGSETSSVACPDSTFENQDVGALCSILFDPTVYLTLADVTKDTAESLIQEAVDDGSMMPLELPKSGYQPLLQDLQKPTVEIPEPVYMPFNNKVQTPSQGRGKRRTVPVEGKKICKEEGCQNLVRSRGLCKFHSGSMRCHYEGCARQSQGSGLCIKHGGGRRCDVEGCMKAAQSNRKCKAHGGGQRCSVAGCSRSSQGGGFCRAHGGGQQCKHPGCTKGAQRDGSCALHGGIRRCVVEGCEKNDRGGGFCAHHGGGKRCATEGCVRPSRKKGMCAHHYRLETEAAVKMQQSC